MATWQRQLERSQQQVVRGERILSGHQARIATLTEQLTVLTAWHSALSRDNASNRTPARIHINLDGGFSGGENLTYLIEMGYEPLTVGSGRTAGAVLHEQPADAPWVHVTPSVRLWEGQPALVGECPYALRRIVQRWQAGEQQRTSFLLLYQAPPYPPAPLCDIFTT